MNYCEEDGLHAIKLMAEVYLREIRMSLLLLMLHIPFHAAAPSDKENTTESKKQSKRLKKVRPKVSAKLKNIDKKTHVESAARICNTGPSRCESDEKTNSVPLPCSGRHTLLCDQAKVVRGEACRRIDDLLLEWKNYKKKAEEELRQRYCIEQKLRQSLCEKEKEVEELSSDLCSARNCMEEQKQLIDHLNEELEESACRDARFAEVQEQAETLANCVDQLKSEIQCRDEKVRCLEQERDSLSCLNMELCEKNLQLEGTIAEWKEDVNATRAELEILDDLVHSFDYKNDDDCCKKTICRRCTLPLSTCRCSKLPTTLLSCCKKKVPKCRPVTCKRPCDVIAGPLCKKTTCSQKKTALCALRALQRQHAAKCNILAADIQRLNEDLKSEQKKIESCLRAKRKIGFCS